MRGRLNTYPHRVKRVSSAYCRVMGVRFKSFALPDLFIEHGSQEILRDKYGLSVEEISKGVLDILS